ncbi:MAG: MarR family transcriptional regulator [Ardenticatenaceae bacterium]|nr:MarR family transcriptional regulator [Ardenticatenaceae bacterium]
MSTKSTINQPALEKTLGFNLHVSAFVLKQGLKSALKKSGFDLTTEEFVVIMLVSPEGIEQTALQHKLYKDKTNVTRLLDRLAAKNLISRVRSQASRRQQIVSLTEEGVSTKIELVGLLQNFSQNATRDISPEEQQVAVRSLQQLIKNLT